MQDTSLKVIIDTKIGLAVKALRKHDKVFVLRDLCADMNPKASLQAGKLATELTAKWKMLLAANKSATPPGKSSASEPAKIKPTPSKPSAPIGETTPIPFHIKSNISSCSKYIERAGEKRTKVCELLEKALLNKASR
jgi:hypothetical protein